MEFKRFTSSLGAVLTFIKNASDKQRLTDSFKDNNNSGLDADSVMVINSCTGANIPLPEKDEVINVCKAIEDIRNDGRIEGRMEGRMENQAEMIEALKANGVSDDIINAALKTMQEKSENK